MKFRSVVRSPISTPASSYRCRWKIPYFLGIISKTKFDFLFSRSCFVCGLAKYCVVKAERDYMIKSKTQCSICFLTWSTCCQRELNGDSTKQIMYLSKRIQASTQKFIEVLLFSFGSMRWWRVAINSFMIVFANISGRDRKQTVEMR